MVTELLVLGFIFFVLVGSLGFYFYSRLLYVERKINLLETILLDIKMTMEMEDAAPQPFHGNFQSVKESAPIIIEDVSGTPLNTEEAVVPKDQADFYNMVLESTPSESPAVEEVVLSVSKPDYESMSRDELVSLAEKRMLRLTKGIRKPALVSLLREADKNSSSDQETGKSDANGVAGNMERSGEGAPLDMVESDTLSMESPA
jgi:hypothetical protein